LELKMPKASENLLTEQVKQHDKRIVRLEIEQKAHEDVCTLRYQNLCEKHDKHDEKHAKVAEELKTQSDAIICVSETIGKWGFAFKVFLFCMGVLVGLPAFILTILKIIQIIKSLGV